LYVGITTNNAIDLKTDCRDITEILLKVALNQLNQSFVQMRNEIYACSEIVAQFHY